jgi:outer membrane protein
MQNLRVLSASQGRSFAGRDPSSETASLMPRLHSIFWNVVVEALKSRFTAFAWASLVAVLPATAIAQDATSAPPARTVTLAAATEMALQRQPNLKLSRANTQAGVARIEEARSGYLPQVTGTAAYQRTTGNFVPRPGALPGGFTAPSPSFTTYDYWNFALLASQLIYDFGQTNNRWSAAEASADSLKATERQSENLVVYNVRTAYFTARAQKALVKVAEETVDDQSKHLEQTEGFVKYGTQPEIALATAKTNLANARVQLITAQNGYETAKAQLNQAMGVEQDTAYDVSDEEMPPVEGENLSTDALVPQALDARPDLASLVRQKDAQAKTVRSLEGGYGPSLTASTQLTEQGTALDGLVPNWYAGLTLTWPILLGGLTRGQVREAEANLAGVDAQIEAIRLQVRLDIDQARLALRAAKANIQAAQDALDNARSQLKLAEGRYSQGVGSIIELTDAQVARTSAEAQLVQAEFSLSTARAQLLTALGRR